MNSESDSAIAALVEMTRRHAAEPVFVDFALSRRLERAEAEASAGCARAAAAQRPSLGAAIDSIGGGLAVFLGLGSTLTQATGIGMDGEVTTEEFSRLEEFYFSRGATVNTETSPFAHPSLFEHFAKHGYHASEHSSVLIRRIEGSVWPRPEAPLTIAEVPPDHMELWVQTVAQGFADSFPVTEELRDVMRLFASNSDARKYLAFFDGAPAGASALSLHDGIAGLFGASTLPEFRRRGIQRELILARIEEAFKGGCEFALTFALPGSSSERNILRNGFRVAYTRTKFTRELPTSTK
jgi:ribosomal protein S18 acetylase RimI-like enzyme